ncbi:MAG TPA: response regulator [Gammaproteobacteria bacterium]|nr:response regulator [Gammaproteobacteria bacterium]
MRKEKKRILIVDDSANDIQVIMENLMDDYAVTFKTNGKDALEYAVKSPKPDVILLDVVMPEMDGYETCRRLKANPLSSDIDVIFVSAHDTTEEKIAGYEAGGSDYLIKPVRPEEIRKKIKLAEHNREEQKKILAEKEMAFSTAMTAMSSAGEQGIVLEFLRNSFSVDRIDELARRTVEAVTRFEVSNTVQLRTPYGEFYASTSEPVPPLERELLLRLKDKDHIISIGKRAIFNYGNTSLLIKNMPEDDDKRGRYRDHLAILMEGVDSKLDAILLKEELYNFLEKSNTVLTNIQAAYKVHKKASIDISDKMLLDLESSFTPWGLSEDQERLLIDIVQAGNSKALDLFESGEKIDLEFRKIIDELTAKF